MLTGSEVSAELLASKGVGTFNGEAGARPKLKRKNSIYHTWQNNFQSTIDDVKWAVLTFTGL